jgi:5-methylcytosine-specific restriction endonuclease McrA
MEFTCYNCKVVFQTSPSSRRATFAFCTAKCFGKYRAQHPERYPPNKTFGLIPWNTGKKMSEETRAKQSLAKFRHFALHPEALERLCVMGIGRKQSLETIAKRIAKTHGKTRTPEQRARIGEGLRGSKNGSWRGGVSPVRHRIRNSSRYRQWRNTIFRRDDYTCQNCGNRGFQIEPHHELSFSYLLEMLRQMMPADQLFAAAISSPMLFDITNGITLCRECHALTDTFAKNTAYHT